MRVTVIVFKSIRLLYRKISSIISYNITKMLFWGNGVSFSSFSTKGVPFVSVGEGGSLFIGKKFSMNNNIASNPMGCNQPCTLFVDKDCSINIGNNVGISQTALISHCSISIGDNVKIGGGTCIYTTDFHSLDPKKRATQSDKTDKKVAAVTIDDNVFIGAKCIILKGVCIRENSIVGAGSVVTRNIPPNQIWAGNPARFIRYI